MKKLSPLLLLVALFACGKTGNPEKAKSENILENLTYTIDTVIVDPGEDIINLSAGLRLSSINPEVTKLYLFNRNPSKLQVIDLENMQLSSTLTFDREGPNGIGTYTSAIKSISEDRFIFVGVPKLGVYSVTGTLSPSLDFSFSKLEIEELRQPFLARQGFAFNEVRKIGYFLSSDIENPSYRLAIIDFQLNKARMIDLPELEQMANYRVLFDDNGMRRFYSEQAHITEFNSKVYIGSTVTSGLYEYDPKADSLVFITFPHQLTPVGKTVKIQTEVFNEMERDEQLKLSRADIKFKEMIWDKTNNRYYRFASRQPPEEFTKENPRHEVYFYAFDSDFKLIGETQLNELTHVPEYPFFKDGKLYSYVNVEDELGFAVFTFNF
ncbi:DUF4221 family protein [Algoriphagus chordae]|uniref:Uncharacterized protein DUF4221 n=1 Tax=Algoriphagus chordae TaxID=237019 RepID=A0A2W7QI52_9BACT|nr:DUF4221 family protein [Algoriphagus chordae]PZX47006.1 uncharacterized protein DUF4221 [Algoriphagus chordae]